MQLGRFIFEIVHIIIVLRMDSRPSLLHVIPLGLYAYK